MKRFYVSHFSGLLKDSEFAEIRDQIIKENLFDPDSGRDHRRVRWPDGRTTDQSFTHLWADRAEAQAFADRLRQGPDDHRWKVFEVDVEGTLAEILDPRNLSLPEFPSVVAIRHEAYVDSMGDDTLKIRVLLKEKIEPLEAYPAAVKPIRDTIQNALASEKIDLFAYIDFRTEAEDAKKPRRRVS